MAGKPVPGHSFIFLLFSIIGHQCKGVAILSITAVCLPPLEMGVVSEHGTCLKQAARREQAHGKRPDGRYDFPGRDTLRFLLYFQFENGLIALFENQDRPV